ncbi:hypothetical protein NKI34_34405 [Mesorhizobium sp. M0700]|uniref:hypothetical protein n=1 Tax=Mesorhizobium sp. M0700 TaxID=2956988 RepID=UPI003338BEBB
MDFDWAAASVAGLSGMMALAGFCHWNVGDRIGTCFCLPLALFGALALILRRQH